MTVLDTHFQPGAKQHRKAIIVGLRKKDNDHFFRFFPLGSATLVMDARS